MGKIAKYESKPFVMTNVLNKELVIKMLQEEEKIAKSEIGKIMYQNPLNLPFTTFNVEYALNRMVLLKFGFDTTWVSVKNYRSIFRTYFKSPTNYDVDVINASYYMKNNRCVFYTSPELNIGDLIPNGKLFELNKAKTSIYAVLNNLQDSAYRYTIIAGFSLS